MRITDTSDLWWKNAVVYCLDVETFFDSDGDGTGDLAGLAQRIDYLADLGVTCLWLMPFYPTPDRDDGYDIVDFYGVDKRLGSLGDFVEVVRTANDRGMRVIADLVVNHTSDQHPWFKARARPAAPRPYRDFYVWRDEPPKAKQAEVVFPDQETSVWEYDEKAGQYYLHQFYKHQPDLNVTNPKVRDEIVKVMGFWLELGLSGFRVDAVPFFLETNGVDEHEFADPHALPARPARRSSAGAPATASCSARSTCRTGAAEDLLRRHRRRRADDAVRLHRDAEALPVAGARATPHRSRRRCWTGRRSRRTASGRRSCATTTS